jgi:hypothetical protein
MKRLQGMQGLTSLIEDRPQRCNDRTNCPARWLKCLPISTVWAANRLQFIDRKSSVPGHSAPSLTPAEAAAGRQQRLLGASRMAPFGSMALSFAWPGLLVQDALLSAQTEPACATPRSALFEVGSTGTVSS